MSQKSVKSDDADTEFFDAAEETTTRRVHWNDDIQAFQPFTPPKQQPQQPPSSSSLSLSSWFRNTSSSNATRQEPSNLATLGASHSSSVDETEQKRESLAMAKWRPRRTSSKRSNDNDDTNCYNNMERPSSPTTGTRDWASKEAARREKSSHSASRLSSNRMPTETDQNDHDSVVPGAVHHLPSHEPQPQQPNSQNGPSLVEAMRVDPVFAQVQAVKPGGDLDSTRSDRSHVPTAWGLSKCLCGWALLPLIVIALLVYFLVVRDKLITDNNNAVFETPSPTAAPTVFHDFGLPEDTIHKILKDSESPQAQAYSWLLQDDYNKMMDFSNSGSNSTFWRIHQRYALAVLYFATHGQDWKNNFQWLQHDDNECRWYPSGTLLFYPCNNQGQYTILSLADNHLNTSQLPPETFTLLPQLSSMDLSNNPGIQGSIPSEIGQLSNTLRLLQLGSNQLTGDLPLELYHLTALQTLNVSSNNLTGTLASPQIGLLTNLRTFKVDYNGFYGLVPTEMGLLTLLTVLHIQENNFARTLPTQLGLLSQLDILHAHHNQLVGSIPTSFGGLSLLRALDMRNNDLSGPLPIEFGKCALLQTLSLEHNQLTSTLPSTLAALTDLRVLQLRNNNMTGPLPLLELSGGQLSMLETLSLQTNRFSGTISSYIGSLTSLTRLLLYENEFSGSIPTEIGNLSNLQRLLLYTNRLQRSFPSELGFLDKYLEDLWLHDNPYMHGFIPTELGLLSTKLHVLTLNVTGLVGSIPSEVAALSELRGLFVQDNQLTGSLSPELEQWLRQGTKLYVNMTGNQLSGTVPDELCRFNYALLELDCTGQLCGCGCCREAQPELQLETKNTSTPAIAQGGGSFIFSVENFTTP